MKVLVCDNYDSFTFNLVQYLGELGTTVEVFRNDEIAVDGLDVLAPDAVVISPGPGVPSDAGITLELVGWCASSRTPLLGVCLGHQAIGEWFGGPIVRGPSITHGKMSLVHHTGVGVLSGLPSPFQAGRYHSLVLDSESLPEEIEVTAWTQDGVVMALRHVELPIEGVQFHPESILTPDGMQLLSNFVRPPTRRCRPLSEPCRRA